MSLRVEYHELVDTDLEHAWTWYEDQERGLGDRHQHRHPDFGTDRRP